jgi:hypothetical protein
MIKPDNMITSGNAKDDGPQNGARGWFVGHFINPVHGLRYTQDVEIKWSEHLPGTKRISPSVRERATTLTLLLSGLFVIEFPDIDVAFSLERTGDYVISAPGVAHLWRAIEDSVVLTVCWPSIPN